MRINYSNYPTRQLSRIYIFNSFVYFFGILLLSLAITISITFATYRTFPSHIVKYIFHGTCFILAITSAACIFLTINGCMDSTITFVFLCGILIFMLMSFVFFVSNSNWIIANQNLDYFLL